jgi:ubiquinone/menaquinone biosynthesis C-methylase UbiE
MQAIDTRVKLRRNARILDVGCGPGKWMNLFAEKGFTTTGIDSSPWMIRLAKKATRRNAGKLTFAVANIGKVESPSDFYDMVNCVTVLQHILDDGNWRSAIHEMVRVTKPLGHVLIFEAAPSFVFKRRTRHLHFRSMKEYVREFDRSGASLSYWRATDLTYLGLRKYAASFSKKVYYFTGGISGLSPNFLSFMTRVAVILAKPMDYRLAETPLSFLSIGKLLLFRKTSS